MSAKKAAPAAAADAAPKKSKKKLVIIIVAALVLLGGGGGAAAFFMMKPKAHAKPEPVEEVATPAEYVPLSPAFVVNLADDNARYLQADVQLMTRDPETKKALELHAPAVRNRLLLLFGAQSADQLADRRGKERLQQQALNEVRAVLKNQKAADKVDALYFTSLVTQ